MALAVEQPWSRSAAADAGELVDPIESARAAGLRYVSDLSPGICRKRAWKGFMYRTSEGRTVDDRDTIRRIKGLAVPPAWTDVWIRSEERRVGKECIEPCRSR